MTTLLQQIADNVVVVGLAVFAITLGFFAIHYLGKRRQMLHQERMASLVKGLHYAGVAREILQKPKTDSRDHMLSGLRWLLGSGATVGALYGFQHSQPPMEQTNLLPWAFTALIPAALGVANLICWLLNRRPTTFGQRMHYRPGAPRYS